MAFALGGGLASGIGEDDESHQKSPQLLAKGKLVPRLSKPKQGKLFEKGTVKASRGWWLQVTNEKSKQTKQIWLFRCQLLGCGKAPKGRKHTKLVWLFWLDLVGLNDRSRQNISGFQMSQPVDHDNVFSRLPELPVSCYFSINTC